MEPSDALATYTHRFAEKITIENTDRLLSEIEERSASPHIRRIVFDLENVRECSSYGLRLFLVFQRKADASGRQLILYRPQAIVRELLSATKLDHVFTIADTI